MLPYMLPDTLDITRGTSAGSYMAFAPETTSFGAIWGGSLTGFARED